MLFNFSLQVQIQIFPGMKKRHIFKLLFFWPLILFIFEKNTYENSRNTYKKWGYESGIL
jgi:hypothetical protein